MPQRHAEPQLALAFEIDLVLLQGHFQNALERRFRNKFRIQQAHETLFDGELLHVASLQLHDDRHFFRAADRDAKLRVLQLRERLCEWIDAHAEAPLLESVTQFVQVEDTSVHRPAAPLR